VELFETVTRMGHEQVLFYHNPEQNLKAIIAIHDASLGSAMGATRLWPYASEADALRDVLRLSRGMTYKAACANIPVGGGKGVIIAEPKNKTSELLRAYGRFVNSLNGRFITGQDVNLSARDVREIYEETKYVVGVSEKSGGPASVTAQGVLFGIKAAVEFRLEKGLDELKIAIQGLGNVGSNLCKLLYEEGATLFVSDINPERTAEIERLYGATVVAPDEIYTLDVDVFSPCALGATLNNSTIPFLKASIVAGAANNQLENEQLHGKLLKSQGIFYCPDYVINAGGLIDVYNEKIGYQEDRVFIQLKGIYHTLLEIFNVAQQQDITNFEAAQQLARERIKKARLQKAIKEH
jgi:leucine dehydrogenase